MKNMIEKKKIEINIFLIVIVRLRDDLFLQLCSYHFVFIKSDSFIYI